LDLPRSWVDQLVISKENFESVTPSGKKIIIYSNAKYVIIDNRSSDYNLNI